MFLLFLLIICVFLFVIAACRVKFQMPENATQVSRQNEISNIFILLKQVRFITFFSIQADLQITVVYKFHNTIRF